MTEATEVMDDAVEVFTGVAGTLTAAIEALSDAREKAVELESGLDTQAAIKKVSTELRGLLLPISRELHGVYSSIIDVRADLLSGVGVVQQASKKEALLAKQAEIEALLADM